MADVRVRLQTAHLRLEYHGGRELFERVLAPLLMPLSAGKRAVATEGARRRVATSVDAGGEAPDRRPAPERVTYAPPQDRFGTFRRQLDAEQNGDANRLAAYAFFLWNYEKKEFFREDEVVGCFAAEGLDLPGDLAQAYGDLLTRRMLAPGAAERTWRLTGKGRDYVRHHLFQAG